MAAPRALGGPSGVAPRRSTYRPAHPLDPFLTLAPLRHGHGDPTIRFEAGAIWRATRTALGPATLRLEVRRDGVEASAWGDGAEAALAGLPRLLGAEDDPASLRPRAGLLRDLARRFPGLRFGRTDALLESAVPAVIEQKVTGDEARRAYRLLVLRFGQAAPGPGGLRLPPSPEHLRRIAYHDLHPLGLELRRVTILRRLAERAAWLEAGLALGSAAARSRLQAITGVGPWTAAESIRAALGDPDALSLGDYHLPHLVCWALAGEPRGTDERMLDLLEPYQGQRARVARLLEASGLRAPRYGPRMAGHSIGAL